MQRIVVETEAWMTGAEFTQLYAISQAAPGPNVLITSLVGFKVAGLPGAFVTLAGFCLPAGALALLGGRRLGAVSRCTLAQADPARTAAGDGRSGVRRRLPSGDS
jgi:chromate transport protein ChrA